MLETTGLGRRHPRRRLRRPGRARRADAVHGFRRRASPRGNDVVICFPATAGPGSEPGGGVGAYAVIADGERTIRVLANSLPFSNDGLAEAGNAALVIRALGRKHA